MAKILFKDYSSTGGLTVGELKKILESYPDDMKITINVLNEYFPARIVEEDKYNVYPNGCNGVPQGKDKCLKIE